MDVKSIGGVSLYFLRGVCRDRAVLLFERTLGRRGDCSLLFRRIAGDIGNSAFVILQSCCCGASIESESDACILPPPPVVDDIGLPGSSPKHKRRAEKGADIVFFGFEDDTGVQDMGPTPLCASCSSLIEYLRRESDTL